MRCKITDRHNPKIQHITQSPKTGGDCCCCRFLPKQIHPRGRERERNESIERTEGKQPSGQQTSRRFRYTHHDEDTSVVVVVTVDCANFVLLLVVVVGCGLASIHNVRVFICGGTIDYQRHQTNKRTTTTTSTIITNKTTLHNNTLAPIPTVQQSQKQSR